MASTPSKSNTGGLPPGYASPFSRQQMVERIDDSLCCVAMLAQRSLAEIKEQAFKFGLPRTGPAWVFNDLIAKLLFQYGLVSSDDKEVDSPSGLPDVAIVQIAYDHTQGFGRKALWHHVRGTAEQAAFHYLIDPLGETDSKQEYIVDLRKVFNESPIYYQEITPRQDTAMARKGK